MKQAILYFVKYPTPGKVKTRLAKTVGIDQAARAYRNLAENNFEILKSVKNVDLIVLFDPPEDERLIVQWLSGASDYLPQCGEDLGERLSQSIMVGIQNGYNKVVVVGSDILGLTAQIIDESFGSLDRHDVVIGPAFDGGYYLIGVTGHYPELFQGISWSTSAVFTETCQVIKAKNLKYSTLAPLDDLDEIKIGEKQ